MRSVLASAALASAALIFVPACGSSSNDDTTSASSSGAGGATTSSGSGGATGAGGAAGLMPGVDATITPFDAAHVYFTGEDNKREVYAQASFPETGAYATITLHLSLACPQGGCDPWDRFASLGVVTEKGENGDPDTVIEVARFITPFHVGGSWDIDVTDLRPLLTGDVTMRAFIDTWVGPGSQYGDGWLVTASFEMKGGVPAKVPVAVVPVWSPRYVVYGDPEKPIAMSVPPAEVTLPAGSSYALRTFVTGHGQGNKGNCAEFCAKNHTVTAGGATHEEKIWRDDCATTAAPKQQGTYKYPRAGWCPGADVKPWTLDVTADVAGSGKAIFGYDVEAYENTCRPGQQTCTGCTLGTGCDYDGGAHTEPNYQFSSVLIAYE